MVLQQYITPREPSATRVELVGDRFLFAMRSAATDGFELCPPDACLLPAASICPADAVPRTASGQPRFQPSPLTAGDPLVEALRGMCRAEGIEQTGIEFVEDAAGDRWVYDISCATDYSSSIERHFGVDGFRDLARYLRTSPGPAGAA